MKKIIFLFTFTFVLFLTLMAKNVYADNPGFPIDPPADANIVTYTDPNTGETHEIATWDNGDGTSTWECTNGNSTTYDIPPAVPPPVEIPSIEIPPYEPPTFEPPVQPPTGPVCGSVCSTNAECPQSCPVCAANASGQGGQKICQAVPTATPTTAPVCGADCSQNPNICQNISNCNYCNPSSNKCEAQPTPTPTSTPQPTATPTLTPTPTPPFSEDMCKCDGIETTGLALGQKSTITAYGKVTGDDTKYAKIPNMTFFLYKGNDQNVTIIDQSQAVTTTLITDQPTLARYKAMWDLTLAPNLDTNATYRIQAKLNCSRKSAGLFYPYSNNAVLGTSSKNPSFLDRIYGFFAGLFGGGQQVSPPPIAEPPTSTPTPQAKGDQLKLGTFRPTKILEKSCTFIKFAFQ